MIDEDEEILFDEVNHFYLLFRNEERPGQFRKQKTLCFWCFNPGLGFKKILKLNPRAVILTSGTLSPMHSFQQELLVDFPIKLENGHVITSK